MAKTEKSSRIMLLVPRAFKADYSSGGIQVFEFRFVTMDAAGHVRNPDSYGDAAAFDDLTFRAQSGKSSGDGMKPYGEQLCYRGVYSVDFNDCARMMKMLKRAQAVQMKFPVNPETFGQYIQMMCAGLGIDGAVCEGEKIENRSGAWFDDCMYTTWKVSEIQWLVDRRIAEFIETHKERMVAAQF